MQKGSSLEKWQAARTKVGEGRVRSRRLLRSQLYSMLGCRSTWGFWAPNSPASSLKSSLP